MRSQPYIADDIDLTSLRQVLGRSGLKLLAVAAGIGLVTFAGASLFAPKYASEAQILVGGQGLTERLSDPQLGSGRAEANSKADKEAVASQVIALRSRDLAGKLAAELKLAERAEFNSAIPPLGIVARTLRVLGLSGPRAGESEEERVVEAYLKALRVFQGKDTRVITIEFTSADSELAAAAANRLAEAYQDWLRTQGVLQTADASDWLRPQIEKLSREVSQAEAEAERFRSQANLFRGSAPGGGLNEQQLADFQSEVNKARTARGEADARGRSARELLDRGNAEAIPDVQRSPVIQGLIAQRVRAEREKAEAEAVLLPAHPRMKQINANVADLRRQIGREAATIVEGLEKEAKVVALREDLARKNLDDVKSRVGDKATDMARLASLEGQAKAKRRELETLQASFEAARSRGEAKAIPLEAQIISRARASAIPASPKKLQLALLASGASLLLGLVFVLTRELLLAGRKPAPTAEVYPLPVIQKPKLRAVRATSLQNETATAGEAGKLREFLSVEALARYFADKGKGLTSRHVLIAGDPGKQSAPREANELVRRLAEAGLEAVLLNWTDEERRGSPLGSCAPGIMDLLHGSASFEEIIARIPDSEAHYIAYGNAPAAQEPVEAEQVGLVLDALDEAYDYVVLTGAHDDLRVLAGAIAGRVEFMVIVGDVADGAGKLALSGAEVLRLPTVGRGNRSVEAAEALA